MAWTRLDEAASTPWAGPLCAAEDAEGQERLFMVGGSSPSRALPKGVDFEEALGDDVPMELWTRQLRGSFCRSVLAFPPKPRSGCTWTALGASRLLLLGGRSQGHCLADVHILQLQGPKMPSKTDRSPKSEDRGEDSDSEAEAIFFASELRASGKPPKAQKSPQEMVKRRGSDSETDSEEEPVERSKVSNLSRAMPCSTQEVLAMASQVKMTKREDVPKGLRPAQTRRKTGGDDFPEARWRQPQALEEHTPPRPRAGHSAVLQVPVLCGETPAVLVYGGLGDGGLPLGDTYELRILETEDQCLEFVWSLLDAGGKEHCETAPWEHQSAPRPRACHSAVFWSGSQRSMVVFGGLGMGLEGEPKAQGDCWLYLVGQRSAQDSKEYERWKVWCQNKLLTLDKLPEASRGAFVYTLLSGRALEAVEHLEPSACQKTGGDKVLWDLLDARFPKKEKVDELGEILADVFSLQAKEGETMKIWSARAQEVFDKCDRKMGVKFPDQARGWLTLNRAGLTNEQRAVVIARAGGDLGREAISAALRSCYPELTVKKRAVAMVDEVLPVDDADEVDLTADFPDVREFLEDHQTDPVADEEEFAEPDVAEVLAASWREKRQELGRLQKARQFGKAKEIRRSFRVEVEELKARTTCHRCGKKGHWAKECSLPKGAGKGSKSSSSTTPSSGAAMVVHEEPAVPENDIVSENAIIPDFVASVFTCPSMLDRLRERRDTAVDLQPISEVALVSCPGFGVLDSGCGRTIIGARTLNEFTKLWQQRNIQVPKFEPETHQFKYGNGEMETSHHVVAMPVTLAGRQGVIRASVVKGDAPLLISRSALKKLGASLDFGQDCLRVFGRDLPLQVNQAGQYVVDLLQSEPKPEQPSFAEVMTVEPAGSTLSPSVSSDLTESADPVAPSCDVATDDDLPLTCQDRPSHVWTQEHSGVSQVPCLSQDGPQWKRVFRRTVKDVISGRKLFDEFFDQGVLQKHTLHAVPSVSNHVLVHFHYFGDEVSEPCRRTSAFAKSWKPNCRQARCLQSQAQACHEVCAASIAGKRGKVRLMEVFSPPRFAPVVESLGFEARSYDLKTGFDLSKSVDRKRVEDDLVNNSPDLLVLSPPCTHEGGWFHLNGSKLDRLEYLQLCARSRSYIRWCCKLFRMQVALGGRAVFEHPTGARTWTYEEMQTLCKRYTTVKLHMCRYNLQLPESNQFIRKSTRLLVNDEEMSSLGLLCPGKSDPSHRCHDVIKGSAPGVPSVSKFAAAYTPQFVQAVLDCVPAFRQAPAICLIDDTAPPGHWHEVCAVTETKKEELMPILKKLHQNLGHPPNNDLVRVLRHGQASTEAIELARHFECSFCKSQAKPSVPLPAQTNRVHEFNHQIGLDVKNLRGWLPNQKIKALNVVDSASSFQRMVPFFQTETSSLLRQLLADHWIAWAGPPKEIVLDPAQTNLGDPMVLPCEMQGTQIRPIAAGAHWQLGKVESHGGWFAHVLDRIIEEQQPTSKEEWLSCVCHAHVKNQMIQVHGFSPQQYVMGKNVHVPEDLLNEPRSVVSSTASLTDESLARSQAMRTSARTALVQLQDSRALRTSLLARPRRSFDFKPGDAVAYWRDQKWIAGKLHLGGRWHGPGIVIGHVGRNVIVMHRKQLLRCAPEQVRPSTDEERQLVNTPQIELLGIKSLIESGGLQSKNYIDLVPQSYPQMSDRSDEGVVASEMQRDADSGQALNSQNATVSDDNPPPLTGEIPASNEAVDKSPAVVNADVSDPPVNVTEESSSDLPSPDASSAPSSYGPIRRRVVGKDGPLSLFRPPAMRQDDFVEIMKEVVPNLIEEAIMSDASSSSVKRTHDDVEHTAADDSQPAGSRARTHEVLSVQDCSELRSMFNDGPIEILMAEYLKRKLSKEIPHSKNAPELQRKVDEGKVLEWQTLLSKQNAIKIHYGRAAEAIRQKHADRFIGSRFVLTRKAVTEGQEVDPNDLSTFVVKGRWCLQGHLDPDLQTKAEEGMLKSPTLSQLGRMTLMQVLASKGWLLQLGDIKGAFLEAGPLEERFRPLFAHQPAGGIPGVPKDAVIEVLGNVYGQNDAPAAWFREFNSVVQNLGWQQSRLDPCLYTLRSNNELVGMMGVHVDDTALGGKGEVFERTVQQLKARFPYRKWRIGEGEFCGSWYRQSEDGSIHMSMASFVDKLRTINVPKGSTPETPLNDAQIRVLRAVNGSLNWLSSQTRPDLAVQTSLSQQSFPKPTIHDFRRANQAIRRAKQDRELGLTFSPIALDELTVVCHSDAAWANLGTHTQAGYIIGFTERQLQEGQVSTWCPVTWKSYKLSRAVSSTLAAESQAMSVASSTVEWLLLLLAESLDGPLDVRNCRDVLSRRRPVLVTDCKSLYDHLHSPSSPTSIDDRRTSIDVVIIRESCKAMRAYIRWVPTGWMLADAFTKDAGDPMDLLRSCLKCCQYQISDESTVLQNQAAEKRERLKRREKNDQLSLEVIRALLRQARSDGSIHEVLAMLMTDSHENDDFELLGSEASSMTDACKRRMCDPPQDSESSMSGDQSTKGITGQSPHSYGAKLPSGVKDLTEWGATVLAVGKYSRLGYSYDEMFESSALDHVSYRDWLLTQKFRVDLTPPMKDFVRYLIAVCGWKRPTLTGGAPARRWGHGACMVGDAMLICGGTDATGELGDCWLLQLQSMRWEQLATSVQRAPKAVTVW
eukprot:s1587_g6.t1